LEVGFGRARVPGRFDRRGKWIFDVAHNPNGVDALISVLNQYRPVRPLHALVGVLKDKDWKAMLPRVASAVDQVWLTDPPSAPPERRWDLTAVAREAGPGFRTEPDFDKALKLVQQGAGTVLVTGSFHTVGDAMARLPGFAPIGE
jgi:dihydrofolate synthase/folylpolyglutamate synthase